MIRNIYILTVFLFLFISAGYTQVKNITFVSNQHSFNTAIYLSTHQYYIDTRIYLSKFGSKADKIIYIDTDDIIEQKYILGFLSMQSRISNIKHEYISKSHSQYTSDHSVYFTNMQSTADISYYVTDSQDNADVIVITEKNISSLSYNPLSR